MTSTTFKAPNMTTLVGMLTAKITTHEESLKRTPLPRHEVLIRQELATLYGVLLLVTGNNVWAAKNVEHQRAAQKLLLTERVPVQAA